MQEIFKHDDNIFYRLFNETDRYVSVLDTDMTILEMNQAMMSLIGCEYTNTIKDMPYWELPMWRHSPEI
ncbi:MAG: GGDEF domain-containing protein, partial [Tissierellia bacterium]|nr:GGDEF domain-containing protein [Tissierellia bacterium]